MRASHLGGIIGLALLGLTMSAEAATAAGNPCSPLTYGAVGDGTVGTNNGTLNTAAIQSAIDACATRGGGIVALNPGTDRQERLPDRSDSAEEPCLPGDQCRRDPAGHYRPGAIQHRLPQLPDARDQCIPVPPTAPYEALVFAFQAVDTGIIGTGTINGQGNVVSTTTNRPAGTGINGVAAGPITASNPSYLGRRR